MSTNSMWTVSSDAASPDTGPKSRPVEPSAIEELKQNLALRMRDGEKEPVAALVGLSTKQLKRQLLPGTPVSLKTILVMLAFYPREDAEQALLDVADAVRNGVIPEVRAHQNRPLFGASR